jgi:hypothetical protein
MSTEQHRIDENRKDLVRYIFSDKFCMSIDLQLLILDYVFVRSMKDFTRKIIEYKKAKIEKCWIRIGVSFSEDKVLGKTYASMDFKRIFYEVRVYNEKEGTSICSYNIDFEDSAMTDYDTFCQFVTSNSVIRFERIVLTYLSWPETASHYIYSPNDNCTYVIHGKAEAPYASTSFEVAELLSKENCKPICKTIWKTGIHKNVSIVDYMQPICQIIQQRGTDNILKRLNTLLPPLKIEN